MNLVLVFACKLAWSMLCYSNTSWCHYRACGQWLQFYFPIEIMIEMPVYQIF
jgi:putative effector of murein hydrolase